MEGLGGAENEAKLRAKPKASRTEANEPKASERREYRVTRAQQDPCQLPGASTLLRKGEHRAALFGASRLTPGPHIPHPPSGFPRRLSH